MRFFDTSRDDLAAIRAAITEKPSDAEDTATEESVARILARVRNDGDEAVIEFVRRFDAPALTVDRIEVGREELEEARRSIPSDLLDALEYAAANIQEFHRREAGRLQSWMDVSTDGRLLGQIARPVRRAGIYVPGGQAAYPSTVLMSAIPASVAGVEEVVVCTPPGRDGRIPPLVAAACRGWADRVFRVGGPAAIAAMAFGTKTIPKVDVLVGPGSRFVNAAKRQVYGAVAIDMLAGPSEVCIIADEGANTRFAAADLLAQIEHDADNRGVVLAVGAEMSAAIAREIDLLLEQCARKEILRATVGRAVIVTTRSIAEAAELADEMAPEHLHLQARDPMAVLSLVRNAGAILLGDYTAAAIGDYVAGPSHTLPTAGTASFSSPLSVANFMKRSSVLSFTADAARVAAAFAARIADGEGFDAHAHSARVRLEGASS
jgi:histidinol dehydrogenase